MDLFHFLPTMCSVLNVIRLYLLVRQQPLPKVIEQQLHHWCSENIYPLS